MRDTAALETSASKSNIKQAQVLHRGNAAGTAEKLSDKRDLNRSREVDAYVNSDVESP